jgi:two-component system nitrogen regulation response regulator GlnG
MCHGHEIFVRDLPTEFQGGGESPILIQDSGNDWKGALKSWLDQAFNSGDVDSVKKVIENTERTLISSALEYTHGKKHEAANLIGWGRNTLTRKIQSYHME